MGAGAGALDSTVAIQARVESMPAGLPEAAQAPARALEQELAAALDSSDGGTTTLSRVAERLGEATDMLGQVEQAGGRIEHLGGMLKAAWAVIAPHIGLGGPGSGA